MAGGRTDFRPGCKNRGRVMVDHPLEKVVPNGCQEGKPRITRMEKLFKPLLLLIQLR